MPDTSRAARERHVSNHIFLNYILEGRYAINGHYLVGGKLAWKCEWCGGRLEAEAGDLAELLISNSLAEQCMPGVDNASVRRVRIP